MHFLMAIFYRLGGFTAWHPHGCDDGVPRWRRYNISEKKWEMLPMNETETAEANWHWSTRGG